MLLALDLELWTKLLVKWTPGAYFTKSLCGPYPNFDKIQLLHKILIQLSFNFAHAMTAQLLSHAQKYDLIWSLEWELEQMAISIMNE